MPNPYKARVDVRRSLKPPGCRARAEWIGSPRGLGESNGHQVATDRSVTLGSAWPATMCLAGS
jgi:hypothetical protein